MADFPTMALDAAYATLGVAAVYRVGGAGDGATVAVMRTLLDPLVGGFETGHVGDGSVFEVRVAEVALPAKGDTLTLAHPVTAAETTYVVQATPRAKDARGYVWVLDCAAQ